MIKEIQKLINTETQKRIYSTLSEWFENDPELVNARDEEGRTCFHLLVLANKYKTLDNLLGKAVLKEIAKKTDNQGNNLLHLAVANDTENKKLLAVLVKHLRELLDIQNHYGQTPFQEALQKNKQWVLDILSHEIENTHFLRKPNKAILPLNLSFISESSISHSKHAGMRSHRYRAGRSSTLSGFFQEDFSISRSSSSKNLVNMIASSNINLEQLGVAYQQDSPAYRSLLASFCKNLANDIIDLDLNQNSIVQDTARVVVSDCIKNSSISMNKLFRNTQSTHLKLSKKFSAFLSEQKRMPSKSNFSYFELLKKPMLELSIQEKLLLLILSQDAEEDKRAFNFKKIANGTLFLLHSTSFCELMDELINLYKHLQIHEKLIANYVAWQLVTYYCRDGFNCNCSDAEDKVKLFCQLNTDEEAGLNCVSIEINIQFDEMIKNSKTLLDSYLFKNFKKLDEFALFLDQNRTDDSFKHKVQDALLLPYKQRDEEVLEIRNAIHSLTIQFVQKFNIKEFHECDWKENKANVIAHFLKYSDNVTNYFIKSILSQKDIKNALLLMIEIANLELGKFKRNSKTEVTDFNVLFLIAGVLGSQSISRLKEIKMLPKKALATLSQLNDLTYHVNNFENLRDAYKACKNSIIFLGIQLRDFVFAQENNDIQSHFSVTGSLLVTLFEMKAVLGYNVQTTDTDLISFLRDYVKIDEDIFYSYSQLRNPGSNLLIDLNKYFLDWPSLLTDIEERFLNVQLLPSFIFNKEIYSPYHLAYQLMMSFTEYIESLTDKNEEDLIENDTLIELFNTFQNLIFKILNLYEAHAQIDCINQPDYNYREQLHDLKKRLGLVETKSCISSNSSSMALSVSSGQSSHSSSGNSSSSSLLSVSHFTKKGNKYHKGKEEEEIFLTIDVSVFNSAYKS